MRGVVEQRGVELEVGTERKIPCGGRWLLTAGLSAVRQQRHDCQEKEGRSNGSHQVSNESLCHEH